MFPQVLLSLYLSRSLFSMAKKTQEAIVAFDKKLKKGLNGDYTLCCDIIEGFRDRKFGGHTFGIKLRELFTSRRRDLLVELYEFLPAECVFAPPAREPSAVQSFADDFVSKIRETFDDDDHTYKSFLHIFGKFVKNHGHTGKLTDDAREVFKDKPGLFDAFARFVGDEKAVDLFRCEDDQYEMDTRFVGNEKAVDLFRCEDDQYEMDMLNGRIQSAILHSVDLYDDYLKDPDALEESENVVKHYFTAMDLSTFRELYRGYGNVVIAILETSPVDFVKTVLPRLRQKRAELEHRGTRLRSLWKQAYKDHHRN